MANYNAQFTNTNAQVAAANTISNVGIFNAAVANTSVGSGPATGDMFNAFAQAATAQPQVLADYIQNARVLISQQIVADDFFFDPLDEYFNVGNNPLGGSIQVITQDAATPTSFDNIGSNPYVEYYNDAAAQLFTYKLDLVNYRTFKGTQLNMFFKSPDTLNSFIKSTAISIANGHKMAQFFREKLMFSVAMELGLTPYVVGGAVNDMVHSTYDAAYAMTYPNRSFNVQQFARATKADRIAIVVAAHTILDIDLTLLTNAFNPKLITNRPFTIIPIDEFPDVWRYSVNHVVTAADVTSGLVDISTSGNVQTGIQVGSTLLAGTLAAPNAGADAEQTFFGSTLQAWVGDRSAVMYLDDLPFFTTQYPNNINRGIQIVGHSKRSYVYSNSFQTCGVYSVAPTAPSAGQALVKNTALANLNEVGVALTSLPNTLGANATVTLNVRGTTTNPAFS